MSVFGSIVFYNIVFALILYFLKKGQNNVSLERIGLLVLAMLAILRFDIGADYESYHRIINNIIYDFNIRNVDLQTAIFNSNERYELSFIAIIWLFRNFENAYIYVFATYSLIILYFWYKTLKSNKYILWGVYAIVVFSILFNSFNGIRQGVSYAIFIYSIQFLYSDTRNVKKYVLYTLLATLFHTSALILFLILPLAMIKRAYVKTYLIIIIVVYLAAILGLTKSIHAIIFQNSFIRAYYLIEVDDSSGGLLTMSIYTIFYTFLMYKVKDNALYSNLLFIGITLYCLAAGDLSIRRISYYFLNVVILAFPYFVKNEIKKSVVSIYTLSMFLVFQIILLRGDVQNGCIPYDYIWSKNGIVEKFRIRGYRDI